MNLNTHVLNKAVSLSGVHKLSAKVAHAIALALNLLGVFR